MQKMRHNQKGVITVEAALVLPVFISIILTIGFFIRFIYIHEMIQHAVCEAANEIAAYGYLYHISGAESIHNAVRDGISENTKLNSERLESIVQSYTALEQLPADMEKIINEGKGYLQQGDAERAGELAEESRYLLENAKEDFNNIVINTKKIAGNPVGEIKSIAFMIAGGAFEDVKTQLMLPLVRFYAGKHLETDDIDAHKRLTGMHIIDGFHGLDFSKSRFFEDGKNDIDIIVRYKVRIPLPVRVLPEVCIIQRAVVKAWLGGGISSGLVPDTISDEDNIWLMNNFQRGWKLREIYAANLPSNYPVISKYNNASGHAVMIKSLDVTAKTYQNTVNLRKKLEEYIVRLAEYEGNENPFGSTRIIIRKQDIKARQLLLVIPGDPVNPAIEACLADMAGYAARYNVELKVEKYGCKSKVTEQNNLKEAG